MSKKPVRVSDKTLQLAKQQLMIGADALVSVDELITLLIMQNQPTVAKAQDVLDYMGDEFAQKVNGRSTSRLRYEKGHFIENDSTLGINRLLSTIDNKPSSEGLSEVMTAIEELRKENTKEHRRQFNMFNVQFLAVKMFVADLLSRLTTSKVSAKDVLAEMTLSDKNDALIKGVDGVALRETKAKTGSQQVRRGNYND